MSTTIPATVSSWRRSSSDVSQPSLRSVVSGMERVCWKTRETVAMLATTARDQRLVEAERQRADGDECDAEHGEGHAQAEQVLEQAAALRPSQGRVLAGADVPTCRSR